MRVNSFKASVIYSFVVIQTADELFTDKKDRIRGKRNVNVPTLCLL